MVGSEGPLPCPRFKGCSCEVLIAVSVRWGVRGGPEAPLGWVYVFPMIGGKCHRGLGGRGGDIIWGKYVLCNGCLIELWLCCRVIR